MSSFFLLFMRHRSGMRKNVSGHRRIYLDVDSERINEKHKRLYELSENGEIDNVADVQTSFWIQEIRF